MRRAFGLLALLASCTAKPTGPVDSGASAARRLTILSTADVGGDTEPCGCKIRPLGGVARRVHAVRGFGEALVVDGGDHFFRTEELDPRDEPQARATAELLADALAEMKAQALVVGERDLALGRPALAALGARARLTLLGGNLIDAETGTAAFARSVLARVRGVSVGIVGVSLPSPAVLARVGLQADPPAPVLELGAAELRQRGAEVVVALIHAETAAARALLAELPTALIDVAIVGGDRIEGPDPELIQPGPAALILPGQRGKWLDVVELALVPGAKGVELADAEARGRAAIAALDSRIREVSTASNAVADRAALLSRLQHRREKLLAERGSLELGKRHALSHRLEAMDVGLPEDPAMAARVRDYLASLERLNVERAQLGGAIAYLGSLSCKRCHAAEYSDWRATPHGQAFQTLTRAKQGANLDCVPCHSTGFDRPGGPGSPTELGALADVGCESCHGPGALHAKTPTVALARPREVPESVCRECHKDQADQKPFVYVERIAKIARPPHQLSARETPSTVPPR